MVTGVEAGDRRGRHMLGHGRDERVAALAVGVADLAEVPVEAATLDQPRQRRLVELGDATAGEGLLDQDAVGSAAV